MPGNGNLRQGLPQIPDQAVFNDYAPDVDPVTPGILLDCDNVYPSVKGYRSYPSLSIWTPNKLASQVLGAFSGKIGVTQLVIAGVANALYELQGKVWVNSGLVPSVIAYPSRWRFDVYGQDLIAVNGANRPYVKTGATGTWGLLGGNPPVSSIVQSTEFALFLIETNSANWHASLSDTIWTDSIATQTVSGSLYATDGQITAAVQLRRGIAIYKRKGFHYGTFQGPPFYWEFPPVSNEIGAPSQEAIANVLDMHLWPGPDDFYSFDGQSLTRIKNNLKEWFFSNLDQTRDNEICSRWDQRRSLVFWHFPSIAAPSGLLDKWICYSLRSQRWSKGDLTIEYPIFGVVQTGGLTYGDFTSTYQRYSDIPAGFRYGDLRDRNTDSTGVFKTDHGLYLFVGAPTAASVTTHDFGDRKSAYLCTRLYPQFAELPHGDVAITNTFPPEVVTTPGATLEVYAQQVAGTAPVLVKTTGLTDQGWFDFTNTARLQRFKLIFNTEAEITGVSVDVSYAGQL